MGGPKVLSIFLSVWTWSFDGASQLLIGDDSQETLGIFFMILNLEHA